MHVGVAGVVDEVGEVAHEGGVHRVLVVLAAVEVQVEQVRPSLRVVFLPALLSLLVTDHFSNVTLNKIENVNI